MNACDGVQSLPGNQLAPYLAAQLSGDTRWYTLPHPVDLESGERVPRVSVAYRTWGELSAGADNAVLVCHALTGSADADAWWPGMIGAGAALDPARDFIICSNVLGGCYGTTGPVSTDADTGERYGSRFPRVTVRDMVGVQRALIAGLGVRRLRLVLGPSLGGMQVLEWAALYGEMVDAIAPIGVSGRHSAWCIGISEAQRHCITSDPLWQDGRYDVDAPPAAGLAAARMMAMVTYRSWQNFEERFGREGSRGTDFDVSSYLRYQGEKINSRFDAATYVRLTQAMDSHDLARGRGEYEAAIGGISTPALVVAVSSDVLYPPREQRELSRLLPNARYAELDSPHGHDGFLIDIDQLGDLVRDFRRSVAEAR